MKVSLITRIIFNLIFLFFICFPATLHAGDTDSLMHEIEPSELSEAPNQMTQKEMNDLFGEDPYLGQTSYLQSPDGFSQRDNSK